MRNFLLLTGLALIFTCCNQEKKKTADTKLPVKIDSATMASRPSSNYTIPDLSPMDMIYYPSDYPLKKMSGDISSPPLARIIYSRPHRQGRKIFGELVKYNQPWRLGANEATEVEFFSTATIQNKIIKPGRYVLYCIPQETKWTLVLNSNLYSWGLEQNRQKDLMQFEIPIEKNNTTIEYFTMAFENSGKNANLLILWDDIKATLPIKF
jgi:hypothetical protein